MTSTPERSVSFSWPDPRTAFLAVTIAAADYLLVGDGALTSVAVGLVWTAALVGSHRYLTRDGTDRP